MAGLVCRAENSTLTLHGRHCSLQLDRPHIVGILNVTPDSFSDGGRFSTVDAALQHGRRLAEEGASLIDIGGESTRPGAAKVSAAEELERVLPVVAALKQELSVPLSIDTSKSRVAAAAIDAGADFVNDISGLTFDPAMAAVVAEKGAGLIVMHTRGRPDSMQLNTAYDNIVSEVIGTLRQSIETALAAGVEKFRIALDPGIGFGKDVSGNLELLRRLPELAALGYPVMLGTSRKSFIGHILGQNDPGQRLIGSLTSIALGYAAGARLFRVHDVAASREAVLMAEAVCMGADWSPR